MSGHSVLFAHFHVEGCRAECLVNGVPLVRLDSEVMEKHAHPVEEYVVSGRNELEILVEPGDSPQRARYHERAFDLRAARATFTLFDAPEGLPAEPSHGAVIASVQFELRPDEPATHRGPVTRSVSFDLPARSRWAFEDAPPLVLDEALVAEALDVVRAVGEALRLRSLDGYEELVAPATRDAIRAYPVWTTESVRSELEEFVAWLHRGQGTYLPIDPARFEPRLVAGGRMIQCVDSDFSPTLKLDGHEGILPYALTLGRVDGRLRVMRY
jgi:hypothetical protein